MDQQTTETNHRQFKQIMFLLFGVQLITLCIVAGVFYVFGFNDGLVYNETHVLPTEWSSYKTMPVEEAMMNFVDKKLEKENNSVASIYLSR
jgi:FtsH-binding integral membrane protein